MKIRIAVLLLVLASMGCGFAKMKITKFDDNGNIVSVNKVVYGAIGSRKLNAVAVNIESGEAKIGSSESSAGDLGTALKEAIIRIPKIP